MNAVLTDSRLTVPVSICRKCSNAESSDNNGPCTLMGDGGSAQNG